MYGLDEGDTSLIPSIYVTYENARAEEYRIYQIRPKEYTPPEQKQLAPDLIEMEKTLEDPAFSREGINLGDQRVTIELVPGVNTTNLYLRNPDGTFTREGLSNPLEVLNLAISSSEEGVLSLNLASAFYPLFAVRIPQFFDRPSWVFYDNARSQELGEMGGKPIRLQALGQPETTPEEWVFLNAGLIRALERISQVAKESNGAMRVFLPEPEINGATLKLNTTYELFEHEGENGPVSEFRPVLYVQITDTIEYGVEYNSKNGNISVKGAILTYRIRGSASYPPENSPEESIFAPNSGNLIPQPNP